MLRNYFFVSVFSLILVSSFNNSFGATIFSENFGTGSTVSDISDNGWSDGGNSGTDAEKRAIGSGDNTASPDGGRFAAMLGDSGYICRTVNATGYTSVGVSYYWRGDSDAGSASDNGLVEIKSSSGNNCSDSSGWITLADHDMRTSSSWQTQSTITNAGMNNTSFLIRFRDSTKSSNEDFRIDGILISGTLSNTVPTATSQATSTPEDTAKVIKLTGSDSDLPAQTLTFATTSNPSHGTLGTISGSQVTYTPALNYNGADSFSFVVSDGIATSTPATISITVNSVNDNPVISAITDKTVNELSSLTFTASSSDADGDTLSYSLSGAPSGALINPSSGVFSWTPTESQGPNSYTFNVVVNDGNGGLVPTPVNVTVNEVNITPTGSSQSVSTPMNQAKVVTLASSDTDVPTQTLTFVTGTPGSGTLGTISGSQVTYTPNTSFVGNDSFTYTISDGVATSTTYTVSITVSNDAPVLSPIGNFTLDEETPLSFSAIGTDPNSDPLTYSLSGAPSGASIDSSSGAFTWTPTESQGPNSYTFNVSVTDGAATDSETITVTINEVNVAPVANNLSTSTNEDNQVSASLTSSDVDNPVQSITYATTSNPTLGTITSFDSTSGLFTYMPNANVFGVDTFTFKVNDGVIDSANATATITINSVNDVPVMTLFGGTPVMLTVGYKDYIDPMASSTDVEDGILSVTQDKPLSTDNVGTYDITYSSTDSNGATASIVRTVIIVHKLGGSGGGSGKVGCMDKSANNYDSEAAYSGTCTYGSVLGASTSTLPTSGTTTPSVGTSTTQGQVLGVSTFCKEDKGFLKNYLRKGAKNNESDVIKLKELLNEDLGIKLKVDGNFDEETENAVKIFQTKYSNEILTPWGISKATGIVYVTTLKKINQKKCPEFKFELPRNLSPMING